MHMYICTLAETLTNNIMSGKGTVFTLIFTQVDNTCFDSVMAR